MNQELLETKNSQITRKREEISEQKKRLNARMKQIRHKIAVSIQIYTTTELRGDIDNYAKFVYDALQKSGVIKNDKQIRESHNKIYLSDTNALVIQIWEYDRAVSLAQSHGSECYQK